MNLPAPLRPRAASARPGIPLWISTSLDPAENLAAEECLLRGTAPDEWRLLAYRNRPCAIVGRNQNPWTECAPECWRPTARVPVFRRVSAGGAVVHDPGNANLTLIGPRSAYDPGRHTRWLLTLIESWGAPNPIEDERHSIFCGGRKVSGSAFMLTGSRALQHATLLLDADLARIRRCLEPGLDGVETRAQPSHRVQVRNLCELRPGVGWADFLDALIGLLRTAFAAAGRSVMPREFAPETLPGIHDFLDRYRSWEWRFGRTPPFSVPVRLKLSQTGEFRQARLLVRRGRVSGIERAECTPAPEWLQDLRARLEGRCFDPSALAAAAHAGNCGPLGTLYFRRAGRWCEFRSRISGGAGRRSPVAKPL